MSGAAPGAKLISVARLPVHRRLHGPRPDRGHDLRREAGATSTSSTCRSAACRRSTTATTPARVLYDRLIEQYNVQMFISAGNSGPGVNTVGDPSVASKVMSVGAYITDATWQSNYGSDSPLADNLHRFCSRGPARGRRLQAAHRRAGRGGLHDAALAGGRPGRRHVHAAARLLDVQRHLDGLAAGRRRGRAPGQRRQAGGRPAPAGPAAAGADLVRALHRPAATAPTSRATA